MSAKRSAKQTEYLTSQFGIIPVSTEEINKQLAQVSSSITLHSGGISVPGKGTITPRAINRSTRQFKEIVQGIANLLDAYEDRLKAVEKRNIGKGIVSGHGPRSKSTFGRGGRKQY